jgi:hypothetical protein
MCQRIFSIVCIMLSFLVMAACSEKNEATRTSAVPLNVFQQEITSTAPPQTLKLNEKATIDITIKNTGNEVWINKGSDEKETNLVALGFFWHNAGGKKIDEGQGTAMLPNTLEPGSSLSLKASIVAPSQPGSYKLYFSMFQNNVAWLNDKGATPLVINVKVKR